MGKRKAREEKARRERKKNHTPTLYGNVYRCPDGPPAKGVGSSMPMTDEMAAVMAIAALSMRKLR